MKYTKREIKDLAIAWLGVSIAFWIILRERFDFTTGIIAAILIVGLGFVLHELAHKYVAQRYGYWSEFFADYKMLGIALILALLAGIVFAAPGAVYTHGNPSKKKHGQIALAGPLTNIILMIIFFILGLFIKSSPGHELMLFGTLMNGWLAVFNLIPVRPFDGKAIWEWNKTILIILGILGIAGYVYGITA